MSFTIFMEVPVLPEEEQKPMDGRADNRYLGDPVPHYYFDIVLCIDCTASMRPAFSEVQHAALGLPDYIISMMRWKRGDNLDLHLRFKILSFRNYVENAEHAIMETDFFQLPEQQKEYAECIRSLHTDEGRDAEEVDGLEALAFALKSDWYHGNDISRQIIIIWSDTGTHPLGWAKNNGADYYPRSLPQSFNELSDWWEDMDWRTKRLILYAPDMPWWSTISSTWNNVIHYPSRAGMGCNEVEYSRIINCLYNS